MTHEFQMDYYIKLTIIIDQSLEHFPWMTNHEHNKKQKLYTATKKLQYSKKYTTKQIHGKF